VGRGPDPGAASATATPQPHPMEQGRSTNSFPHRRHLRQGQVQGRQSSSRMATLSRNALVKAA